MDVDLELVERARELIESRSDDRYHTTASAARAKDGGIVVGVNVFHFTGGPCAELVVLGRAVADGATELRQIVAVGDRGRGVLSPCGRCRQVMLDLFPAITVVVQAESSLQAMPVRELLPWPGSWDPETGTRPQYDR